MNPRPMLPLHLSLVRHGESEGNVYVKARDGKLPEVGPVPPEFLKRHSTNWRLTTKGIAQVKTVGEWLKAEHGENFYTHFRVSEALRAVETAAHLELPNAQWIMDFRLRERDHGLMDVMTVEDRTTTFARNLAQRKINSFYWAPHDGESMARLCERLQSGIIDTLHRRATNDRAILVCHGEVLWGMRIMLERIPGHRFVELDAVHHGPDEIYNGQVIEYTRINPTDQNEVLEYYGWTRSVCPWDTRLSTNEWRPIVRETFSNEDLLAFAEKTKRLVDRS